MRQVLHGTFHFHSTYSHDGRSTLSDIAATLSARGFSFCVMTDHFEDFDATTFSRYVQEANDVTQSSGLLLIPGVEVDLSGLHTIVFPVHGYAEVAQLASGGKGCGRRMFKVLAHPSNYAFERVIEHLQTYEVNGIELWNQQADGGHIPPLKLLKSLQTHPLRSQYRYFFGCDLHNVKLTVTNVLSIVAPRHCTPEAIVNALIEGDVVCCNRPTGIEYRNGSDGTEFDNWLQNVLTRSYWRGRLLRGVRRLLRASYKTLPRDVQHSLNDIKNFVRSKV